MGTKFDTLMSGDYQPFWKTNAVPIKDQEWFQNAAQVGGADEKAANIFKWLTPAPYVNAAKNWLVDTYKDATGQNVAAEDRIAYTKSGVPYDKTNTDSMVNALATEYANNRDDYAYDRLIAALKRNGINPAIALSNSASPMSSDSGFRSSYNLNAKDQVNSALKAGSLLLILFKLLAS